VGLDFDPTSAYTGLGAMIERANYTVPVLKDSSLGPPVKEDREILPLQSAQHLERGLFFDGEVFVRRGPLSAYGYSRQLGHDGLG
jgi:hypothetical protein